jgi:NADH-quinone oxidoreductase subunit G
VPVVGEDDKYPKDVKGNPVEPVKFTIRAEKCPNRCGVEAVLKHLQGAVIPFADVAGENLEAMWFAGGYPDRQVVEIALAGWKAPSLVIAQDLFPTALTAAATFFLPATSSFEKDGTFINHAGLAQTFARSVRPPQEARTELQLAFDLLGRKGLVQAAVIRTELAQAIPAFAGLAEKNLPANGLRFELAMV